MKYIVKTRQSDGVYACRGIMGTITGLRWGKWFRPVSPTVFDTLEEAIARASLVRTGLGQVAVFFGGKKVWMKEC